MKVVLFSVNEQPKLLELEDSTSFSEMQKLVRGYIQDVPLGRHHLLCNEDGIALELPFNMIIKPYGTILGNFIIVNTTKLKDGSYDYSSLTEQDLEDIELLFDTKIIME